LIGTVFGTGTTNAFADDQFDNKVNIETDMNNTNCCDESGAGTNDPFCKVDDHLTTSNINILQGKKNKIDSTPKETTKMTVMEAETEITLLSVGLTQQRISDQ
jgi:hypothetical protein